MRHDADRDSRIVVSWPPGRVRGCGPVAENVAVDDAVLDETYPEILQRREVRYIEEDMLRPRGSGNLGPLGYALNEDTLADPDAGLPPQVSQAPEKPPNQSRDLEQRDTNTAACVIGNAELR